MLEELLPRIHRGKTWRVLFYIKLCVMVSSVWWNSSTGGGLPVGDARRVGFRSRSFLSGFKEIHFNWFIFDLQNSNIFNILRFSGNQADQSSTSFHSVCVVHNVCTMLCTGFRLMRWRLPVRVTDYWLLSSAGYDSHISAGIRHRRTFTFLILTL